QAHQHLSIDIMLALDIRLVADTDRLITQIAGQIQGRLEQLLVTGYRIQRLQRIGGIVQDIIDEIEIFLQLLEMSDLVKSTKRIVCIAKPAIAIVPVTRAVMELRQAGGT